jgi:hypothetical protein
MVRPDRPGTVVFLFFSAFVLTNARISYIVWIAERRYALEEVFESPTGAADGPESSSGRNYPALVIFIYVPPGHPGITVLEESKWTALLNGS